MVDQMVFRFNCCTLIVIWLFFSFSFVFLHRLIMQIMIILKSWYFQWILWPRLLYGLQGCKPTPFLGRRLYQMIKSGVSLCILGYSTFLLTGELFVFLCSLPNQDIGWDKRLQSDLFCVKWNVKLTHSCYVCLYEALSLIGQPVLLLLWVHF